MSFVWSNVLAAVAVTAVPFGGMWIAPRVAVSTKRYFFALTLWGAPFLIGQLAQQDEWGTLWIQYHLLDLAYASWGTALVMLLLLVGAHVTGRHMSDAVLCTRSLAAVLLFGYGSELWDTFWTWYGDIPLRQAADVGDYKTITAGAVMTMALHLWFRRPAAREVAC